MIHKFSNNNGYGLIEVIVAAAIISTTLVTLAGAAQIAFRAVSQTLSKTQGEFLVEESLEVARVLRDVSYASEILPRTTGLVYYPNFSTTTNTWTITSTNPGAVHDIFTQTVLFYDVFRDANKDIVASTTPGATLDPDTKEVVSRVVWNGGGDESIEMRTYMTDLFDN